MKIKTKIVDADEVENHLTTKEQELEKQMKILTKEKEQLKQRRIEELKQQEAMQKLQEQPVPVQSPVPIQQPAQPTPSYSQMPPAPQPFQTIGCKFSMVWKALVITALVLAMSVWGFIIFSITTALVA